MTTREVEIFGCPNDFQLSGLGDPEPNVWNGTVNVTRYRIIVEEIKEPAEVLRVRLQHLLANCTHHSYDAIHAEAKRLGVELE